MLSTSKRLHLGRFWAPQHTLTNWSKFTNPCRTNPVRKLKTWMKCFISHVQGTILSRFPSCGMTSWMAKFRWNGMTTKWWVNFCLEKHITKKWMFRFFQFWSALHVFWCSHRSGRPGDSKCRSISCQVTVSLVTKISASLFSVGYHQFFHDGRSSLLRGPYRQKIVAALVRMHQIWPFREEYPLRIVSHLLRKTISL